MSGSTYPKLVGQWLAENDQAANVDELDHSGLAVGTRCIKFNTLGTEIVKGILKTIPREFRREIDLLNEKIQRMKYFAHRHTYHAPHLLIL